MRSRSRTSAGSGSSNGRTNATTFVIAGVFMRASNRSFARAEVGGVLGVDDAARADGARHQLAAVAAAGSHIEHLHARAYAGEGEELHRISALVDLAVRVAAVGRRHDGGVVRRGLRERRA